MNLKPTLRELLDALERRRRVLESTDNQAIADSTWVEMEIIQASAEKIIVGKLRSANMTATVNENIVEGALPSQLIEILPKMNGHVFTKRDLMKVAKSQFPSLAASRNNLNHSVKKLVMLGKIEPTGKRGVGGLCYKRIMVMLALMLSVFVAGAQMIPGVPIVKAKKYQTITVVKQASLLITPLYDNTFNCWWDINPIPRAPYAFIACGYTNGVCFATNSTPTTSTTFSLGSQPFKVYSYGHTRIRGAVIFTFTVTTTNDIESLTAHYPLPPRQLIGMQLDWGLPRSVTLQGSPAIELGFTNVVSVNASGYTLTNLPSGNYFVRGVTTNRPALMLTNKPIWYQPP